MFNQKISNKNKPRSRTPFSKEEDSLLRSLVNAYGEHNWYAVAAQMPNRSVRQCRERYQLFLSGQIKKSKWTPEEDALLIRKHAELGSQWKTLEVFFNGRTSYNIRNRWISLSRGVNKFSSGIVPIQNASSSPISYSSFNSSNISSPEDFHEIDNQSSTNISQNNTIHNPIYSIPNICGYQQNTKTENEPNHYSISSDADNEDDINYTGCEFDEFENAGNIFENDLIDFDNEFEFLNSTCF